MVMWVVAVRRVVVVGCSNVNWIQYQIPNQHRVPLRNIWPVGPLFVEAIWLFESYDDSDIGVVSSSNPNTRRYSNAIERRRKNTLIIFEALFSSLKFFFASTLWIVVVSFFAQRSFLSHNDHCVALSFHIRWICNVYIVWPESVSAQSNWRHPLEKRGVVWYIGLLSHIGNLLFILIKTSSDNQTTSKAIQGLHSCHLVWSYP